MTHIEECSCCLNKININNNYTITNCGHKFHSTCIFAALKQKNSCPLCRKTLYINMCDFEDDDTLNYENIVFRPIPERIIRNQTENSSNSTNLNNNLSINLNENINSNNIEEIRINIINNQEQLQNNNSENNRISLNTLYNFFSKDKKNKIFY